MESVYMKGDMQRWTPNVASIIEHAKESYIQIPKLLAE